ncbi:MAG: radical SAM protein [Fervidicoccaceae archaeon]
MGVCLSCGKLSRLVSSSVGACYACLVSRPGEALSAAARSRERWRESAGLPPTPPRNRGGPRCAVCVNECSIPEGGLGFCGVWAKRGGALEPRAGRGALVAYTYLDPLPTNCVATPVCPAATSRGYPIYTKTRGAERGRFNLAVFLGGCNLDCFFCQNIDHKRAVSIKPSSRVCREMRVEELIEESSSDKITCVCFFGGDPTPHVPILLRYCAEVSRLAKESGAVKRICWETNGLMAPNLMRVAARFSLESGGIVKIDWKAWTPSVYEALTGVDGERALERLRENARLVAEMAASRPEPPLLVISVLLVPGYVGPREVGAIASFAASLPAKIPMVLLAFYPQHLMWDLPTTSKDHVEKAVEAAKRVGAEEVYVGNAWLVRPGYLVEEFEPPAQPSLSTTRAAQ